MGVAFAEVAAPMMAQAIGTAGPNDPTARIRDAMRVRLPLSLAACAFVLVALWEVGLYLYRGEPPARAAKKPAGPDPAVKLLEELMQQADAAMAEKPAPGK
jgi:hypothetical protein